MRITFPLVFIAGLSISISAQSTPLFWTVAENVNGNVNIRQNASLQAPIIGKLTARSLIQLIPAKGENGFSYISYDDGLKQGYVWSTLLEPLSINPRGSATIDELNDLTRALQK